MKLERKILIGVTVVLVIESGVCIYAYIHQQKAGAVAQAKEEVHQQAIDQRDAAAKSQVKTIQKQIAAVTTPEQAAEETGSFVTLAEPIRPVRQVVSSQEPGVSLPDAPSAFVLPRADVLPIYRELGQAKQNQALLDACLKNRKDLEAQRDDWKKAYRGGNWAVRALRNPKLWVALGGIGGFELGRHVTH